MTKPELQFIIHGEVPDSFWQELEQQLEECYRRLPTSDLEVVQVRVLDTVERLRRLLAAEHAELGIAGPLGEEFLALHDAWRGGPRITVCRERLTEVPPLVGLGAIRQQVAHSILHGSPEYYTFKFSRSLVEKGRERGLAPVALQQLLYYVAIAVKDYEVVRLLVSHGYDDCQAALAFHQLETSDEDRLAWRLARLNPVAHLICLASQLKLMLSIRPLVAKSAIAPALIQQARAMLSFLPLDEQDKLWALTRQIVAALGDDTHQNMATALQLTLEIL
ncbi:MAG: hypothetical protein FJ014_13705 [Chloroflexi bacterium]|nr:hypothetical protein [Chloroflexota bacterium]